MILLTTVLCYLACWIFLLYMPVHKGIMAYLLFTVMGASGSGFVLTFACAKEIIHPDLSGMAVSVVNTGCFIGTSLMQPLFGWIADLSWNGATLNGARIYSLANYHDGFMAMLAFGVIGLLGAMRIRETHCRNISNSFK